MKMHCNVQYSFDRSGWYIQKAGRGGYRVMTTVYEGDRYERSQRQEVAMLLNLNGRGECFATRVETGDAPQTSGHGTDIVDKHHKCTERGGWHSKRDLGP